MLSYSSPSLVLLVLAAVWLASTSSTSPTGSSSAFSIETNRLHGIWRLSHTDGALPTVSSNAALQFRSRPASEDPFLSSASSSASSSSSSSPVRTEPPFLNQEDVLLKLNPDGSFRQCNEGHQEGSWLSGCWKLVEESNQLVLAVDRQYYGPPVDILLDGVIMDTTDDDDGDDDDDKHERQRRLVQGKVWHGKFAFPKQHAQFFEEPLLEAATANQTGAFSMQLAVATYSVLPDTNTNK
jgi:hypothetical protein